jgi:hypothetical protein
LFERQVVSLDDGTHRLDGGIRAKGRDGLEAHFSFATVSVGLAVRTADAPLATAQLMAEVTQAKPGAKAIVGGAVVFASDRRSASRD